MKLSWKIFFSTLIITILTFSIGGYVLVTSTFKSALERELAAAKNENKISRNYFQAVIPAIPTGNQNTLSVVSESVIDYFATDKLILRIYDKDYIKIAESAKIEYQTKLLDQVDDSTLAYAVIAYKNQYYIQTASAIHAFGGKVYLESFHNISSLYSDRTHLFSIYKKIIACMLLFNGLLVFLMTLWTISPIKKLVKTTRAIAQGQFSNRVRLNTKDEIGLLADDFNQMAESLEIKIHDLEAAAKRQQDFIGSFAHELKTPLTSIIGYADMLRSKKMSDENMILASDYIFSEGKRLERLSLKLLDLLVVQNQNFPMQKVSMKNLFASVHGIMFPILFENRIQLLIEAEDTAIFIEPDLMKTLIINLCDNARKSISGNGTITLIGMRNDLESYTIIVSDTGKGIPAEDIGRITEAFYMVDKSRARAEGGAGLGLALCMEIAKLHNGSMTFESEPGIGTHVCLHLRG